MSRAIVLGLALVLAGCAMPATMQHAATGQILRCDSPDLYAWGFDNERCITALERQGFVRVE